MSPGSHGRGARGSRGARGEATAGTLTADEREIELRVGQHEMTLLRLWLTGEGRRQQERERKWLAGRLRDLSVAGGLGRAVGPDGFEEFTTEELEMMEQIRRRRNRPPDPRTTSVVAAVVSWLVGTGWTDFVAGSERAMPALEAKDLGVLVIALRLIGDGEGGEVCWEESAGLRAARRIHVDGARMILTHLANNQLLTHRVPGNKSYISHGATTMEIARKAGVAISMPTTAA